MLLGDDDGPEMTKKEYRKAAALVILGIITFIAFILAVGMWLE